MTAEIAPYVAPEVRRGGPLTPQADVPIARRDSHGAHDRAQALARHPLGRTARRRSPLRRARNVPAPLPRRTGRALRLRDRNAPRAPADGDGQPVLALHGQSRALSLQAPQSGEPERGAVLGLGVDEPGRPRDEDAARRFHGEPRERHGAAPAPRRPRQGRGSCDRARSAAGRDAAGRSRRSGGRRARARRGAGTRGGADGRDRARAVPGGIRRIGRGARGGSDSPPHVLEAAGHGPRGRGRSDRRRPLSRRPPRLPHARRQPGPRGRHRRQRRRGPLVPRAAAARGACRSRRRPAASSPHRTIRRRRRGPPGKFIRS